MRKATFGGEYIVEEKAVRETVTVNRTGNGIANKEHDLICCGCCGSVMTSKAKFCMGCGAKFMFIKDIKKYQEFANQVESDKEPAFTQIALEI